MSELPAFVKPGERVVLFDGVCKLCSGWAKFLIQHDANQRFRLASVQSEQGQILLAWAGLPTDRFDSMALIDDGQLLLRSDAVLRIVAQLSGFWRFLAILQVIPRPLRDWCYDRIALNRYRLFGRYDSCLLPTADHAKRFLNE